jgi:ribonucleoside-diphosphate reductase alpha chain
MSNNSAVYSETPTAARFLKEWSILANSGTGERGIFNLLAAKTKCPERRNGKHISGLNPCGEINLRSMQFCNLTEIVARHSDDLDDLLDKVETAVWLGVIQSTFTYFPYLNKKWKKNCEEERLLGVSVTGQLDCPILLDAVSWREMKKKAIKIAQHASKILNINMPTAVTCVKPSGTVSQLVNSSSGLHPRYSKFYIRRYRISSTDPLFQLIKDQGIKMAPENGERKEDWEKAKKGDSNACKIYEPGKEWSEDKVSTWVISFPIKSPARSITRDSFSAIDQLNHYKMIMQNWCEHNASCTVYVKDSDWFEVGNWIYKNWEYVNGVSFLPYDGGKYEQAPYEEISKIEYRKLIKNPKKIDYRKLSEYEEKDMTSGAKTYACVGDKCDVGG